MSEEKQLLLTSLSQFLFEVPLYAPYSLGEGRALVEQFYRRAPKVDGHCMYCGRDATFEVHGPPVPGGDPWNQLRSRHAFDELSIKCVRNEQHRIRYWFYINKMVVVKVGQYPSLADIANDEVKIYRKLLSPEMASEFHKAVGLAAHGVGVGVGSFVYLRRVFEWLIENRFNEFREAEGWDTKVFYTSRMEDKIDLLKKHLPEFLVANRKIYSILASGYTSLARKRAWDISMSCGARSS